MNIPAVLYLFGGYPENMKQARLFQELKIPVMIVLSFIPVPNFRVKIKHLLQTAAEWFQLSEFLRILWMKL